jgi:hypothetical protein
MGRPSSRDLTGPAFLDAAIQLERQGQLIEAEQLLLRIVAATERESQTKGSGVMPACYERWQSCIDESSATTMRLRSSSGSQARGTRRVRSPRSC